MTLRNFAISSLVFSALMFGQLSAQILWQEDGVPLRSSFSIDWYEYAYQNSAGDIYIVWNNNSGDYLRVFGQKYNAQGEQLWPEDVEIFRGLSTYIICEVTSDDGLAVTWGSSYNYGQVLIRAQKLDLNGNLLWDLAGVPVGTFIWEPGDNNGQNPTRLDGYFTCYNVVSDTSGGIFVIWPDWDAHGNEIDLYAKHLLADGSLAPGWMPHGNIIHENIYFLGSDYARVSCTDDAGGFYVSWVENLAYLEYAAFIQRIDGAGNLLWGPAGILIARTGSMPRAAIDGSGGAFFLWAEARYGIDVDLFMQRLDLDGNQVWQPGGITVCQANGYQGDLRLIYDGYGGALTAWTDQRFSSSYEDVFGQRIDGDGNTLWLTNGVAISAEPGTQQKVKIAPDGSGGMYAVWNQWTSGSYGERDSYIQHITATGSPAWLSGGLMLSGGDDNTVLSENVVNLAGDEAMFIWSEEKGDHKGIYMQKTDEFGQFLFPPGGVIVEEAITGAADQYDLVAMNNDRFLGTWRDSRNFDCDKIYYQVFDINGHPLLQLNGEPACGQVLDDQEYPRATATSDGSAIITWWDDRDGVNPRIYSQKINSDGNILWIGEGIRVSLIEESQRYQAVCSDGVGGAYVAWDDYDGHIHVQRMSASGDRLFGNNGLELTWGEPSARVVNVVQDGWGGAIVVYNYDTEPQIFATRIFPVGSVAWTVLVYDLMTSTPDHPVAIPSNGGGAIVAWEDYRYGYMTNIYAQKIDNSGSLLWPRYGATVINADEDQTYPVMVEDALDYVYFAWNDARGGDSDIYCQRLSPEGEMQFSPEGLLVCDAEDYQSGVRVVGDSQGGAIIAWSDNRFSSVLSYHDIFGIHLDERGQIADPFWVPNGTPVCIGFGSEYLKNMVPDGHGGAILDWQYEFTVQRVNDFIIPDGSLSGIQNAPRISVSPNPFNPVTTIRYHLPDAVFVNGTIYDIKGRLVAELINGRRNSGMHEITFDASKLVSGIYIYALQAGDQRKACKIILIK